MNAQPRKSPIKTWIVHPLQALAAFGLLVPLRYLPLTWAAATGATLARLIGPRTSAHKIARRNLEKAFPEKSETEIREILRQVWDNLGRSIGESAQVDKIRTVGPDSRVEIIGEENLSQAMDSGKSFIIFSAHMANWEIASLVPAQRGQPLANIYRRVENPWLESWVRHIRGRFTAELLPKGREGSKRLLGVLKENKPLGLLIDQKLNEGLAVPFFGRNAMTAQSPAELAIRFQCPLIPTRLERLPGSRFRVTILPPMDLPDSGDRKADVLALTTEMNALLESWIRERPGQWFWVHKRWPD